MDGMAAHLSRLFVDPALVERMGAAAREHIARDYAIDGRLRALWSVIEDAAGVPATRPAAGSVSSLAASLGS